MNIEIDEITAEFEHEENSILRHIFAETEAEAPVEKSSEISTMNELEELREALNIALREYDDGDFRLSKSERIKVLKMRQDISKLLDLQNYLESDI